MTVFARSDVASVTISTAHGGCGAVHTRPAPGGEPVEIWSLTCSYCEDTLRNDPLWASSHSSIPETPDEVVAREANDKRTQQQQQERNVQVMEKLAEMPSALRNIGPDLAQALIAALSPLVAQQPAAPAQPAPPGTLDVPEDVPDLDTLSLADLKKLATRYGVPSRRSREDQIAALRDYLGQ